MTTAVSREAGRRGRPLHHRVLWGLGMFFLALTALAMLFPLYIVVVNAFKPQQAILSDPTSLSPDQLTPEFLIAAINGGSFSVPAAYAFTTLLVILVNVFSIAIAAPVSYVIVRSTPRFRGALLIYFVAGMFIPVAAIIIPVIYVLRVLGLMGTIPGLVALQTCLTLPLAIFLFSSYLSALPRELDDAASIDGAGPIRTFWLVYFPLMKPAVATVVILNSLGVWNDFVTPQTILGPASGMYTVTTGLYAAIGRFFTDYTVVFPDLLLVIAPILVFFVALQRYIIGGLSVGATKG